MTLYLMDANVLIRAHADYYPLDRLAPFWAWLLTRAEAGNVTVPLEIYEEVCKSPDLLGQWLRRLEVRKAIVLHEPTNMASVQQVIAAGYAPDLNDIELLSLTRDPFLIAAALGGPDRVVVCDREPPRRFCVQHRRGLRRRGNRSPTIPWFC